MIKDPDQIIRIVEEEETDILIETTHLSLNDQILILIKHQGDIVVTVDMKITTEISVQLRT